MIPVGVAINRIKACKGLRREVFCGRDAVENDRLVIGECREEVDDLCIARINKEGVIPQVDEVLLGERFDFGEVHDHAVGRIAGARDDFAGKRDFERIAVPVQVTALALVIRDAVTGVELEAAGDEHRKNSQRWTAAIISLRAWVPVGASFRSLAGMLKVSDHSRDSAGMTYVYPVVSRRAGGVSVGINLNVNNACNWACVYCQVPNLTRGGPLPVDLRLLDSELRYLLRDVVDGDFLLRNAPSDARRLVDVAFSGNGEPTSAPEFCAAIECVALILRELGLQQSVKMRLITNGSLLHRPLVQRAIARIGDLGGEVWFKLDAATSDGMERINGVRRSPSKVGEALMRCAGLAPTWVQTCSFAFDGKEIGAAEWSAYLDFLRPFSGIIKGVHLYGLARPSLQPAASRLSSLPVDTIQRLARSVSSLNIDVLANP